MQSGDEAYVSGQGTTAGITNLEIAGCRVNHNVDQGAEARKVEVGMGIFMWWGTGGFQGGDGVKNTPNWGSRFGWHLPAQWSVYFSTPVPDRLSAGPAPLGPSSKLATRLTHPGHGNGDEAGVDSQAARVCVVFAPD